MDAIVMDLNYQTLAVIDSFKSFIWTERYNSYGDFELQLLADSPYVKYLEPDNYLYRRESDRLMVIETIEIKTDAQKGNTAIIKGKSLESLLNRRIVWDPTTLSGNLENGLLRVIKNNIRTPSDPNRTIPNFNYKNSNDPYIASLTIDDALYGENIYDLIEEKCKLHNIGFKVTPDFTTEPGGFIFSLYNGVDRSYRQEDNPWVVFSPKMENLINSDYILSRNDLKTAALITVSGDNPYRSRKEVISSDYPCVGFGRREMFIKSNIRDIDDPEEIKLEDFGTPQDRVNIDNYGYTETISSFNSGAYNQAKANGFNPSKIWFTSYQEIEVAPEQDPAYIAALQQAESDIQSEYEAALDSARQQQAENRQAVINQLFEAATNELQEHKITQAFDGEVETKWQWQVNKDYFLGDIVQIVNEYKMEAVARISEIIYSEDERGISIVPSFITV